MHLSVVVYDQHSRRSITFSSRAGYMKSLSMKAGNTDTVEHCCWTNDSGDDELVDDELQQYK